MRLAQLLLFLVVYVTVIECIPAVWCCVPMQFQQGPAKGSRQRLRVKVLFPFGWPGGDGRSGFRVRKLSLADNGSLFLECRSKKVHQLWCVTPFSLQPAELLLHDTENFEWLTLRGTVIVHSVVRSQLTIFKRTAQTWQAAHTWQLAALPDTETWMSPDPQQGTVLVAKHHSLWQVTSDCRFRQLNLDRSLPTHVSQVGHHADFFVVSDHHAQETSGKVLVFATDPLVDGFTLAAQLPPVLPAGGFGAQMIISHQTLAVSAPYEMNGRGSVHVYRVMTGGRFRLHQSITPSDKGQAPHQHFGWRLSLSPNGHFLVVASFNNGDGNVDVYRYNPNSTQFELFQGFYPLYELRKQLGRLVDVDDRGNLVFADELRIYYHSQSGSPGSAGPTFYCVSADRIATSHGGGVVPAISLHLVSPHRLRAARRIKMQQMKQIRIRHRRQHQQESRLRSRSHSPPKQRMPTIHEERNWPLRMLESIEVGWRTGRRHSDSRSSQSEAPDDDDEDVT